MYFVVKGTLQFWLPGDLNPEKHFFHVHAGKIAGFEDYIAHLSQGELHRLKNNELDFSEHDLRPFGKRVFNVKMPQGTLVFGLPL